VIDAADHLLNTINSPTSYVEKAAADKIMQKFTAKLVAIEKALENKMDKQEGRSTSTTSSAKKSTFVEL